MPKAVVLGAGMVGSVMASDLASDGEFDVTLADINPDALAAAAGRANGRIATVQADLSDPDRVRALVQPFDIVLGALASAIGYQTLRAVIEAGKPYCDISFMPEDAWELDDLARSRNVRAVVDCGVAPGMSNMIAGYGASTLERCERIEIYVGGLPREPKWPFNYKAAFSPRDVIEEYTRPARLVENGQIVVKEALSEPELMEFAGVGTLEAFNTDGLRSLAHFLKVPTMKEKTLRYPGHIELMRVLRAMGLFSDEPIEIRGQGSAISGQKSQSETYMVRPIDVTTALMFPMWKYDDGEEDLTVMRITVDGAKAGRRVRMNWDLLDFYDPSTQATSMSRTTAFPCTIVARLLLSHQFAIEEGVNPPELLGRVPGLLDHVIGELDRRGVRFKSSESNI